MKKTMVLWLLILSLLPVPVGAASTSAASAVMLDADTLQVWYQQNADQPRPMASTTKIMTALLALEMLPLDRQVVVKKEYTGIEGSSMYLKEGEVLTVEQLLYGLMLASGNDAAVALAVESAGSVENFVFLMNQKARSLGLTQTSFVTPNGLDDENHYTTARELALLTAHALHSESFCQIVSTRQISFGSRTLTNHNKLLSQVEGAMGVKTGFTRRSGRCLVSAAQRRGRRLIVVTLNDPNDWRDHAALLEEGFSHYSEYTLWRAGETLAEIPLIGSRQERAAVASREDGVLFLTENERKQLERCIFGEKFVYSPVTEQGEYGTIKIKLGQWAPICQKLYWTESVAALPVQPTPGFWRRWWQRLQKLV